MNYVFAPAPLTNYSPWAFYKNAFSKEECEEIVSMFKDPVDALIGGSDSPSLDSDIRKSTLSWLPFSDDTRWIYEKLSQFVMACNDGRYGFDLVGFGEHIQLGRYVPGDHYSWHQDFGGGPFSIRKLSLVLQLSDPSSYEGGELEFQGFTDKAEKQQGDLMIFPSFNPHRVTPVTKGERYSLVAWISGPPYR